MTCRDCIHYDVCEITITDESFTDDAPQEIKDMFSPNGCKHFKNKADYAEVVRCKNCVDYIPDADLDHEQLPNDLEADGYCDNWLKYTDAHCFCSSGRKKMKERFHLG